MVTRETGHPDLETVSEAPKSQPVSSPFDLISLVHSCSSSATSSGSTLVRSHASLHCGFFGALPFVSEVTPFLLSSLLLKTLEKKGILSMTIGCVLAPTARASLIVAGEDQLPLTNMRLQVYTSTHGSTRGQGETGDVSEREETGCCWHRGNVHMQVLFQGFCSSGT